MQDKMTGYPSIDKPWMKKYNGVSVPIVESTVYERIYNENKNHLNDNALNYFGHKISYGEMFNKIEQVEKAMLTYGVKRGDRVVLMMSATPELVYTVLACGKMGAVANLINPLFEESQIIDRTNETKADLMIVLDRLYSKVSNFAHKLCVKNIVVVPVCNEMPFVTKSIVKIKGKENIAYGGKVIKWVDFINEGKRCKIVPEAKYEKDYPFIMVYSSGSTGASKGIVLTHDGVNSTVSHYCYTDFIYEREQSFLQMIPIWFSTGIVLSLLMPLCLGITVILEPVFSKENFVSDIKKYKPNMTLAATSLWLYAIKCNELEKEDLSYFVYPATGGELVLPRVENAINSFLNKHKCKVPLIKGYGMCELGSTISSTLPNYNKPGSTGIPMSNVIAATFDMVDNRELMYGERGEIRVISPSRMKEYYLNEQATDEFFYHDNKGNVWGCTGDVGYIDEDGDIFILGRASDYFVSEQGNKIYCFDVENVILENPNIAYCEVVGVPFANERMTCVAHLILEDDCTVSIEKLIEELDILCRGKLNVDTPLMWEQLLNANKMQHMDLSFLVAPTVGADTLDVKKEKKINEFLRMHGCEYKIAKGYGMTEVGSGVSITPTNNVNKLGSVGIPLCMTTIGIFDVSTNEELKYGAQGEICISGPSVMLGYYKMENEEQKVLYKHSDGRVWMHSGDLGYIDEDGFLFIEGRIKRMIIDCTGFKIFAPQVECVILENPKVEKCCVVGVKDQEHGVGQIPVAVIVLKKNVDVEKIKEEIRELCKSKLSEYSYPKAFIFRTELPYTQIGKVDYRKLEEIASVEGTVCNGTY